MVSRSRVLRFCADLAGVGLARSFQLDTTFSSRLRVWSIANITAGKPPVVERSVTCQMHQADKLADCAMQIVEKACIERAYARVIYRLPKFP